MRLTARVGQVGACGNSAAVGAIRPTIRSGRRCGSSVGCGGVEATRPCSTTGLRLLVNRHTRSGQAALRDIPAASQRRWAPPGSEAAPRDTAWAGADAQFNLPAALDARWQSLPRDDDGYCRVQADVGPCESARLIMGFGNSFERGRCAEALPAGRCKRQACGERRRARKRSIAALTCGGLPCVRACSGSTSRPARMSC